MSNRLALRRGQSYDSSAMSTFKSLITAITLIAVAANPVAAGLLPCCCTEKVQPERPCCQATKQAVQSTADSPSCCAKKQQESSSVQQSGCCCFDVPPAVPASSEKFAKPTTEPQPLVVFCSFVDSSVQAPVIRRFEHASGSLTISGPPLLALYCIWLK